MHHTQSSGGTEAPTFALIIGIDKYKAGSSQFSRLKGAVNDAKLFQKFLTDPRNDDGLEVPPSHIVFLANEKATYSAILSNFRSHLLNNPNIPRGAAMIFFFAGHGSRVHYDGNRMAKDGKVEVICPVDERTNVGGNKVPTIPDYVLAHLFKQLSDKLGDNITVILDTCHSGGMARDFENLRVRSPPTPSANIVDKELNTALEKENSVCDYSVWSPLSTSHTLLAACGPQSMAFETSSQPHNGLFTTALVKALRHAVRQRTTTYNDLIERLPAFTVAQTPLCVGIHKDRLLFTTNHPVPGIRTLPLTEKEVLILEIGSDDDIDEGNTFIVTSSTGRESTFTAPMVTPDRTILASPTPGPFDVLKESYAVIEEDTNMPVEPVRLIQKSTSQAFLIPTGSFEGIGEGIIFPIRAPNGGDTGLKLKAKIVGINQTLLVSQDGERVHIPEGSRAEVANWKEKVNVYMPSVLACQVFPLRDHDGAKRFDQAESYHKADIVLMKDCDDNIIIKRMVGKTIEYDKKLNARFPLETVRKVDLSSVVSGIAHFHFFLERQSPLTPGIQLKMYRLEGEWPYRKPFRTHNGDGNIIELMPSGLYKAEIPSDRKIEYGFEICNDTDQEWFPYLFYFNPVDYLIKLWFTPSAHDGGPLKGRGTMPLGMGGDSAYTFSLSPGLAESCGFIKLFISARYIDLDWIVQKTSPWSNNFQGMVRLNDYKETLRKHDWGTMEVVLRMEELK